MKTNKESTVLIMTLMTLNHPPHSLIVNCQQKLILISTCQTKDSGRSETIIHK